MKRRSVRFGLRRSFSVLCGLRRADPHWGTESSHAIGTTSTRMGPLLGTILLQVMACSAAGSGVTEPARDLDDGGIPGDAADASLDSGTSDAAVEDIAVTCTKDRCVTQISARGGVHACALLDDHSVRCWGGNESAQLGIGAGDGGTVSPYAAAPRLVQNISNAVAVTASGTGPSGTTCILVDSGAVACFGSNASGLLGIDSGSPASSRAEPSFIPSFQATSVVLGSAFALALGVDGRLWSWGANDTLQLAQSRAADAGATSPAPAPADRVGVPIRSYAGTAKNGFAVTDSGELLSWGAGTIAQLGRSTSLTNDPVPSAIALSKVSKVAAGASHACALSEGAVHCWGDNGRGQLGTTRKGNESAPARVVLPEGAAPIVLEAGGNNTCIVTVKGELYCWGANDAGQLGVSPGIDQPSATRIELHEKAAGIAIMEGAICALVRDGTVECLGDNARGQLGRGARDPLIHLEPAPVVFE